MYKIKFKIQGCNNINNLKDFIRKNDIKLILFGEYHGFFKQIQVQNKILKEVAPDFFLYEMLENKTILDNKETNIFLNKPNNNDFSFISKYGDLKQIVRLSSKFNLPLIGCDIKNMGVKSKDWRKSKFSFRDAEELTKKRELQQAKVINNFSSKSLVFVLLGDYHLRRNSLVLSKLKVKKAIIIRPSFKWKDELNNAKNIKEKDISYIVKLYKK